MEKLLEVLNIRIAELTVSLAEHRKFQNPEYDEEQIIYLCGQIDELERTVLTIYSVSSMQQQK